MNPPISVIIPVFNGAATVADTLAALLAQTGVRDAMEVLVVDNNSTDNTVEIVRRFPVTLLREMRPGPSMVRNKGLSAARGEIIVCLDADTLPTRRWLAELLKPLEDPSVLIVGGAVLTYDPQNAAERYLDASGIYNPEHNVKAKVFPFATGMNMAVRVSALREVGGWEEAFRWGEDVDLSHRILLRHPGTLAYAERAVIFHRNRTTLEAMARQAFGYGRGAAVVFRRFPETAGFAPLQPDRYRDLRWRTLDHRGPRRPRAGAAPDGAPARSCTTAMRSGAGRSGAVFSMSFTGSARRARADGRQHRHPGPQRPGHAGRLPGRGNRAVHAGGGRLEVIVVDDGSADATPEICGRFPVTLIRKAAAGVSAARNAGISRACGTWVGFTDSDCIPSRRWAWSLLEAAESAGPDALGAAGKTVGHESHTPAARFVDLTGGLDAQTHSAHPTFPFAPNCNLLYRRSALLDVGGYDERFSNYETQDLHHRLCQRHHGA